MSSLNRRCWVGDLPGEEFSRECSESELGLCAQLLSPGADGVSG